MNYGAITTLKAQVEHVLQTRPETRNSDAELVQMLCGMFGHNPIEKATSIERCRRWFNQSPRYKYLPTDERIARERRMNIQEWRVAMGYPTTRGTYTPPSEQYRTFKYASKTKRGIYYTVKDLRTGYVCDCESFHHRGTCGHVKIAAEAQRLENQATLFV